MVTPGVKSGDVYVGICLTDQGAREWVRNKGGRRFVEQLILSGAKVKRTTVRKGRQGQAVCCLRWCFPYRSDVNLRLREIVKEHQVQISAYLRDLIQERYEDEVLEQEWKKWLLGDDRAALASLRSRAAAGKNLDCDWLEKVVIDV